MALKFGQKLKQIVGTVAPALGTALGGPLGGIAGKFVQDALGVDDEAAAVEMLQSNPDALLKLKEGERAFEARMRELGIDEERLRVDDRGSARTMASATSIWPQVGLSALFICGYFTLMGLFFSNTLSVPMDDTFKVLVGVLTASIPQILAFWFGSSSGSQAKTAFLGAK